MVAPLVTDSSTSSIDGTSKDDICNQETPAQAQIQRQNHTMVDRPTNAERNHQEAGKRGFQPHGLPPIALPSGMFEVAVDIDNKILVKNTNERKSDAGKENIDNKILHQGSGKAGLHLHSGPGKDVTVLEQEIGMLTDIPQPQGLPSPHHSRQGSQAR